jgi:peptidoglycan hydrolase CwlO-like protein
VLFASSPSAARRRALIFAALLFAALCALAGSWGAASAPADPQQKLEKTRDKLEDVREEGSDLAATIAEKNAAIDAKLGEVSRLRQEQEAVEAELQRKQAELDRATEALEAEEAHLERVRAKLRKALDLLGDRLVAIYEAGSPDMLNAILESEDWTDMAAQTEYLRQIQEYDDAVVDRVKTLRDEVRGAVEKLDERRAEIEAARDAIAAKEEEVAQRSQEAAASFRELKSEQAARQEALEEL